MGVRKGSERRVILVGYGLFVACLWTVCSLWAWTERELTMAAAERHVAEVTTAVGEQTQGWMRLVKVSLRMADLWISEHRGQDPATSRGFRQLVQTTRDATHGLVDLRLVTRSGGLRYVGDGTDFPQADVSDREYFQAQHDPARRGFHLGSPVKSRVTGRWGIPVSIPVSDARSDIGVLFAALELDRIGALHERERLKPGGSIALLRDDGIFLSRVPFDESFMQASLADSPLFRERVLVEEHGVFLSDGRMLDGVERLVGFARLEEFGLSVVVAAKTSDILAPWHRLALVISAIAGAATALGALLLRRLLRALRQSDEAKALLARQANIDGLTGLLNHRAFLDAARQELLRIETGGCGPALLMMDLDHFKDVNDTQGHQAGDAALRELGHVLRRILRSRDLAGRVGGEEFCVLLPETSLPQAAEVAERLRREFTAASERVDGLARRVTLSVGVTEWQDCDLGLEDMLLRADQALYRAKNSGRDRVEKA